MKSRFFLLLPALACVYWSGCGSDGVGSGDCAGLCFHLAAAGEAAHCGTKLDQTYCLTACQEDFGPDGTPSTCESQRAAAIRCLESLPIECDPWAKPKGEQCEDLIAQFDACSNKAVPSVE